VIYKIDEFFDKILAPLCQAKKVSISFNRTLNREYSIYSTPLNPNLTRYNFSLIQQESFENLLSATYYLLSLPQESVAAVEVELGSLRNSIKEPFSINYDPTRDGYTVFNPYLPGSQRHFFSSFSQVLGLLAKKWHLIHVQNKNALEFIRESILESKPEQTLYSLFTDPFYPYLLDLAKRLKDKFGKEAIVDVQVNQGALYLVLSKNQANPHEVNLTYVSFLDSHGQELRETLARKVVVVVV